MSDMRALVFDQVLSYETGYPVPQPGADEALIRISCAGICNTDIEITKGYMGFRGVPGHEFAGVVEKCPLKDLTGKRVVGEINVGCGECAFCRSGMQNHCPDRSVLGILNKDGAFAEYITLPVKNLHAIPDSVTDEEAVFVEPLAAAFEILDQATISAGDKVCVLGDGKLGLLTGQVLSTTGCELTVVGKHREKLSLLETLGIRTKLNTGFRERGFDMVVDCTGSPAGMKKAIDIVGPRGKIILKTTVAKRRYIDLNRVVINEISIIGSRCGPFRPAMEALGSKAVNVSPMISGSYALEDGLKAFDHASQHGVMKVILKI